MSKPLRGTVNLPGSKSESNRALMIAAYGGFPLEVENLSDARDTILLKSLLKLVEGGGDSLVMDCQDAGSVARFLMTYLSGKPGTWLLTGTERLCQRPMAPLIDALRQLGADIACVETQGCLPVRIRGKKLLGGPVTLDASQSSQFASSLLMAAPTWGQGLQLTLTGKPVSMPYLDMTIRMMEHFGVQVARNDNRIAVAPQLYMRRPFAVSADWSAASYWYEMMALSDEGELLLKGLKPNSLQGDAVVAEWFESFGVRTSYDDQGAWLTKVASCPRELAFDFTSSPDLFPSVFVTCIALHIEAVFNGVSVLSMKESDRIESLISELSKIYTFINIVDNHDIIIKKSSMRIDKNDIKKVVFNTYNDHRVVMALAGLVPKTGFVAFNDFTAVNKSYPEFWKELNNFYIF